MKFEIKPVNTKADSAVLAASLVELTEIENLLSESINAVKAALIKQMETGATIQVPEKQMRVRCQAGASRDKFDTVAIGNAFQQAKALPTFLQIVTIQKTSIPSDLPSNLRAAIEANTVRGEAGKSFLKVEAMTGAERAAHVLREEI